MSKSRDAFRTISEVAELLDTPAHVLRFWETKFTQVKPVKRAGGRRYYRPNDVALLAGIRQLLHDDGLTIKGVQKVLREQGVKHVAGIAPPAELLDDVSEAEPPSVEPVPAFEPQESATVLPFAQAAPAESADLAEASEDAPEPASVEPPEEMPSYAAATPLFPQTDDPEPHAADEGAPWAEGPEAAPAAEPAPGTAELPGFITESLEARAAETPPPALPDVPDLSALPRPAPGALSQLSGLTRIDAAKAAELAPHVAALQALVAARRGARMT
ncbi:MerR family transcriptional regulator [Alloyangia pacifica]|uniref:MerR family transcriptional regulator n=1 Tax=Alloyangia pacifica TaxID=311180 RepID=A0A2U8HCG4_9RHOB|nr:MerR family transcriptional regulator [Alloyangia pacifica]AWI83370.1 MerR family transcriptional regulator [Alloyangia pacifica]